MGLAVEQRDIEAYRTGTPAAPAPEPSRDEAPDAPLRLPPAEQAPDDRRGPMRPDRLTPSRARLQGWTLGALFRGADIAAIALSAFAAARVLGWSATRADAFGDLAPFALAAVLLAWSLTATRAYGFGQAEGLGRHLIRVAAAFGLAGIVLTVSAIVLDAPEDGARSLVLWFCGVFGVLYVLHAFWWAMVRRWRRQGRLTPNIVVVGANANARRLIESALKTGDVAVLGIFDDRLERAPKRIAGVPVLGDTDALLNHRIMPYVDRVVITVSSMARSRVRQLVDRLGVLPHEIMLLVEVDGPAGRSAALSRLADAPLARMAGEPSDERRALVKRIQDLVIGAIALVCFLPVFVAVAIAIKLDSPGPVFFRQRRHGFNNEEILVWKFRSMRVETTDATASRQVTAGDDRVTRVGRFIRKTSLDELPQLLNVLKGEMSLVGPRPHAVGMKTGETESARLVAEYAHRHRMKPGMTGWAAIKGSRGPVDTPELVRRRVALDIEYIERQSFWRDLYIMAMTIPCLLGDAKSVR
ncbi:MAG TPA: exopolysaccharide biosynthesis polyprenyl glycosylphosphotransferase [Caulobacteraceae bacterium]|nr:exopolysaccharide biosynthesis polyprenyl glycosylphosphotransferase [Caulobacteraceae bacterium]